MDRNALWLLIYRLKYGVALRKESVDRNQDLAPDEQATTVALRKESVDRNFIWSHTAPYLDKSLSARRAWIEILIFIVKFVCPAGRSPQGERG